MEAVTKPYKFTRFGDSDVPKPYEFIGSGGFFFGNTGWVPEGIQTKKQNNQKKYERPESSIAATKTPRLAAVAALPDPRLYSGRLGSPAPPK